jgi:hypothetical protein
LFGVFRILDEFHKTKFKEASHNFIGFSFQYGKAWGPPKKNSMIVLEFEV